mgnify:CR=1 FL=1
MKTITLQRKNSTEAPLYTGKLYSNFIRVAISCKVEVENTKVSLYRLLWHPDKTDLLGNGTDLTTAYIATVNKCLTALEDKADVYRKYVSNKDYEDLITTVKCLIRATSLISDYNVYSIKVYNS